MVCFIVVSLVSCESATMLSLLDQFGPESKLTEFSVGGLIEIFVEESLKIAFYFGSFDSISGNYCVIIMI